MEHDLHAALLIRFRANRDRAQFFEDDVLNLPCR